MGIKCVKVPAKSLNRFNSNSDLMVGMIADLKGDFKDLKEDVSKIRTIAIQNQQDLTWLKAYKWKKYAVMGSMLVAAFSAATVIIPRLIDVLV